MSSSRILAGAAAGLFVLALGIAQAVAQDYPARPITVIVPFAAGGPTDVIARIVGDHMSKTLGQTLVIENVVGAGGTTGITRAKRAKNDGYTIAMGHLGTHAAAPALYPNLQYDPVNDFEPIGMAAGTPVLILAKKDFPPKDLKEFVDYVKENEKTLNMAHAGVGSVSFTTCLLLNDILKVKPTSIPFQGTGPSMNALIGGQVDYMCDQIVNAVPQVQGGTIKALCDRHRGAQSVAAERADLEGSRPAGVPGLGLERADRAEGHAEADRRTSCRPRSTRRSTTRPRASGLLDLGSDIPGKDRRGGPALTTLVKSEIAKWTPVIKAAGPRTEAAWNLLRLCKKARRGGASRPFALARLYRG